MKTLRQAMQQLHKGLTEGRGLQLATSEAAEGLSKADQVRLDSLIRDEPAAYVVRVLKHAIVSLTDWVVTTQSNGQEVRQHFPADPESALELIERYALEGKPATLTHE
ncbi:hypothetical protein MRQ47_004479 [Salmonella enterica]|nr:hypothetical protein [Salmonella enterica]